MTDAQAFAALGDPLRWAIVARLGEDGPLPTSAFRLPGAPTRQGLTKHLQVLQEAGLVESIRVGRDREWRLRPAPLAELRDRLALVEAQWDARIAHLQALVEDDPARLREGVGRYLRNT